MSTVEAPISDLLVTVKAREVQRGLLAEMGGDQTRATRHFLAAAHLELVLADDYAQVGQVGMAHRSRLSAASCFWRASHVQRACSLLDALVHDNPGQAIAVQEVRAELERDYPNPPSASDPNER